MACLHIIHGFLGAGKTVFSKKLAADTGALRLNADEWCVAHYSPDERAAGWDVCFAQSVNALWRLAMDELAAGRDVIFDMGFWTRGSRDDARRRAAAAGADLRHYHVFAGDETVRARLLARTGEIARRNLDNFEALRARFEPPGADEPHIAVDTSGAA